ASSTSSFLRRAFFCPGFSDVNCRTTTGTAYWTCRLRHASHRSTAPGSPGRRLEQLVSPAVSTRLLLLRGRLARADERLRRYESIDGLHVRKRRRLDWCRSRSRKKHPVRPVARA